MSCNEQDPNCQPCKDCPPIPDPILPRCNIALPDGVFTNATVVVEAGCIISVQTGEAPQYTPDVCCEDVGGGGGGGGDGPCDCPPGDPGENATIEIGAVQSVAPGTPARVRNVGTDTNAVLEFDIPRGNTGDTPPAPPPGANNTAGGIEIVDGRLMSLPAAWPPVLFITTTSATSGVILSATPPDVNNGVLSMDIDLSLYDSTLRLYINNQDTALQNQITANQSNLQGQITALAARVTALENAGP